MRGFVAATRLAAWSGVVRRRRRLRPLAAAPELAPQLGHRALHLVHLGARRHMDASHHASAILRSCKPVVRGGAQHLALRLDECVGPLRLDQACRWRPRATVGHAAPGRWSARPSWTRRSPRSARTRVFQAFSTMAWKARRPASRCDASCLERQQLAVQVQQRRVLRPFEHCRRPASNAPVPAPLQRPGSKSSRSASGVERHGLRHASFAQFGPLLHGLLPGLVRSRELLLHRLAASAHVCDQAPACSRTMSSSGLCCAHGVIALGCGVGRVAHSNTTTCRIALPSCKQVEAMVDVVELQRPVISLFTGRRPCEYRSM